MADELVNVRHTVDDAASVAELQTVVLLRSEQSGGHVSIMENIVSARSAGPPLHMHDFDEAFYVLEGELEIACGSERYRAGVGAFAFLPSGIAHTFRAIEDSRVLTIAVPGGFEGFFRGVGRPAEGPAMPPPSEVDIAA